ncbi:MAG: polysaccharide biosynthesis C-terminal domain-containing protein, partial [Erysipelotrichaceae bacterium]|nr:polysaccharide biosynthesis C-terminal domain-containing protein [Erysipelotrichaceae bacterium]
LYASVLSTSVAAIAGLIQIFGFDRKHRQEIQAMAQTQQTSALDRNGLIKELVLLAIPYMVMAILGYSQQIYNAILLPAGLKLHYPDAATIDSIISTTTYVGVKMTAIPMVLAPGFTAAIIPHLTSALIENNQKLIRKNVVDCLNVVFYIGLPVSFCLFVYAAPINYTLFYTDDLATSAMVLGWLTIEAITGTIMPMVTNMMMALRLRKYILRNLVINVVLKGVLMVPLTAILGFAGAVIAALIADGLLIVICLTIIAKQYHVRYTSCFQVLIKVAIGCMGLWLTSMLLSRLGLSGVDGRKWICFLQMCANGLISMAVFLLITVALKVPQTAFHISLGRKKAE